MRTKSTLRSRSSSLQYHALEQVRVRVQVRVEMPDSFACPPVSVSVCLHLEKFGGEYVSFALVQSNKVGG